MVPWLIQDILTVLSISQSHIESHALIWQAVHRGMVRDTGRKNTQEKTIKQ